MNSRIAKYPPDIYSGNRCAMGTESVKSISERRSIDSMTVTMYATKVITME